MNVFAELEAGNIGAVASKLESLFIDDVIDPIEPYVADAVNIAATISKVLSVIQGLVSSLGTPVASSSGSTVVSGAAVPASTDVPA